ncbi:MAG: hypothetical protein E6H46_12500 [Betaproteobacteria bacterium]|nr:MAG: hypothetical protein E6H46_12500 [Betaproteobacteria bacterium]
MAGVGPDSTLADGLYMAPPNNAVVLSVDGNSHDLALIQRADRILVIRYGRIAQSGRHAELLRETGLYAFLYVRRAGEADSDQEPAVVALGAGTRTHR